MPAPELRPLCAYFPRLLLSAREFFREHFWINLVTGAPGLMVGLYMGLENAVTVAAALVPLAVIPLAAGTHRAVKQFRDDRRVYSDHFSPQRSALRRQADATAKGEQNRQRIQELNAEIAQIDDVLPVLQEYLAALDGLADRAFNAAVVLHRPRTLDTLMLHAAGKPRGGLEVLRNRAKTGIPHPGGMPTNPQPNEPELALFPERRLGMGGPMPVPEGKADDREGIRDDYRRVVEWGKATQSILEERIRQLGIERELAAARLARLPTAPRGAAG